MKTGTNIFPFVATQAPRIFTSNSHS